MSASNITEETKLLQQWMNGIIIKHNGHHRAASYYIKVGHGIGLTTTLFTVLISTSLFSGLSSSRNESILLLTGVISVIAAILAGLQTFLNYPELGSKHQSAGNRYGRLRRRIEEALIFMKDSEELRKLMESIRTDWERLEEESPDLPQRFHDQVLKMVKPESISPPETTRDVK